MKKKTKIITVLNLASVLLLILITTTVADVAVADEPNPTIEARLTQNAVAFHDWPGVPDVELVLTIRDSEGKVLREDHTYDLMPPPHPGDFYGFLLGSDFILEAGQFIEISGGGITKTHIVAYIDNLINVDYENDIISGVTDPESEIRIEVWDENDAVRSVSSNGEGAWSADFAIPGDEEWENQIVDLIPWSWGVIYRIDDDGNRTQLTWPIYIDANYESDYAVGENWFVGQPITLTIVDPSHPGVYYEDTVLPQPSVGPLARGEFLLWDAFDLQPGQVVTLAQGDLSRSLTLEEIDLQFVNVLADTVEGNAAPDAYLNVEIEWDTKRYVESDSNGDWLADFSTPGSHPSEWQTWDITTDTRGHVLLADSDGDHSFKEWCALVTLIPDAGGPYLVQAGSSITLDGSVNDPDSLLWTETGGEIDNVSIEDPIYTAGNEAGIFELKLTVTYIGVGSYEDTTFVVVYNPDGGFVTGGGWIWSPVRAYVQDPLLEGKANFGFVSKYKKGATTPTGNTEFQFRAGDLNFHSNSYDWLVVNQGGTNAQFKGVGTINGAGEYKFMLWAGDMEHDTFRIRIWTEDEFGIETDVYDNGTDQIIGGGNIVVHADN